MCSFLPSTTGLLLGARPPKGSRSDEKVEPPFPLVEGLTREAMIKDPPLPADWACVVDTVFQRKLLFHRLKASEESMTAEVEFAGEVAIRMQRAFAEHVLRDNSACTVMEDKFQKLSEPGSSTISAASFLAYMQKQLQQGNLTDSSFTGLDSALAKVRCEIEQLEVMVKDHPEKAARLDNLRAKAKQLEGQRADKIKERVEQMMRSADVDDDGLLCFAEYVVFCAIVRAQTEFEQVAKATKDERVQKEMKKDFEARQSIVHDLRLLLWASRERHVRASRYYARMYYMLAGPQLIISALVGFASALWPEDEGQRQMGRIVVTAGSTLNTLLLSISNMLELQSKKDMHGQAVKLFETLLTNLKFAVEWPSRIEAASRTFGGYTTLELYIKDSQAKITELESNLPRPPMHIVRQVNMKVERMRNHGALDDLSLNGATHDLSDVLAPGYLKWACRFCTLGLAASSLAAWGLPPVLAPLPGGQLRIMVEVFGALVLLAMLALGAALLRSHCCHSEAGGGPYRPMADEPDAEGGTLQD